MTKKASNVIKGIGTAMAIGGTVALVSSKMSGSKGKTFSKKNIKKTAMKAAQTVENVLDGISNVMQ